MRFSLPIVLFSIATAVLACGASKESNPASDGGIDPVASSAPPVTSDDSGPPVADAAALPVVDSGTTETQATCIAGCSAQFPVAASENAQLDSSCFTDSAGGGVCNNLGSGGTLYQPDSTTEVDGGPACNTNGVNSFPIEVQSQACANYLATTPMCCKLWIEIFSSDQGQKLLECSTTCYTQYTK